MTTQRVYRPAMSCWEAIEEIKRGSGSCFDPELVEVFVKLVEKYNWGSTESLEIFSPERKKQ